MTVTLVSGLLLRAGSEDEHRMLHEFGVQAARELGGLVRDELVPAVPGVQDETVALLTFADRAALDRWLHSKERAQILSQMSALSDADRSVNVLHGFPGWFTIPGQPAPPRWKQATLVIAGLIPVSFVLTWVREAVTPDLTEAAVIVLNAVANVCILTWLVMPRLNHLLSPWLLPEPHRPTKETR